MAAEDAEFVDAVIGGGRREVGYRRDVSEPQGRKVRVVGRNGGGKGFRVDGTVVGAPEGSLTENFFGSEIWSELRLVPEQQRRSDYIKMVREM